MSLIVIGSGAAGMACAKALLGAGRQVVMVDEGRAPRAKSITVMASGSDERAGWPVTAEAMATHRRAVAAWVGMGREVALSVPGAALMATLGENGERLEQAGVTFERMSVVAIPGPSELERHEGFSYMPGYSVRRVEESANGVRVHLDGGETMDGERALVAAGVLGTAEMMLRSLKIPDGTAKPLRIKETQGFELPMLRVTGVPGAGRDEGERRAEMRVGVMDERLSPHRIEAEVGRCRAEMKERIAAGMGVAGPMLGLGSLQSRLYGFEGAMHSDHGPVTEARLERKGGGGEELRLSVGERPEAAVILDGLRLKLAGLRGATGLIGLGRWMRLQPGQRGGSFPMAPRPGRFESDELGRVDGMQRVHVVDASVLPAVAAMGRELAVMANAWRIGTTVGGMR